MGSVDWKRSLKAGSPGCRSSPSLCRAVGRKPWQDVGQGWGWSALRGKAAASHVCWLPCDWKRVGETELREKLAVEGQGWE